MSKYAIVRPTEEAIRNGADPSSQTVLLHDHIPDEGYEFDNSVIGRTIFLTCTHRSESEVTVESLVDGE